MSSSSAPVKISLIAHQTAPGIWACLCPLCEDKEAIVDVRASDTALQCCSHFAGVDRQFQSTYFAFQPVKGQQ